LRISTLTHLDLTSNLPLSDDTLCLIGVHCPLLKRLVLTNCIAVSLRDVTGFGKLRCLNLTNCDSLDSSTALPVLETFTALEELIMDSCNLLVDVRANCSDFLRTAAFPSEKERDTQTKRREGL
jgi:hypothetical protein